MKVRVKKTGDVKAVQHNNILVHFSDGTTKCYHSIKQLNEELEDYVEPKGTFIIDPPIMEDDNCILIEFSSHEEAEKAVEKLKAWKRLKEAGFIVHSWNGNLGGEYHYDCCGQVNITAEVVDNDIRDTVKADLDLLFGGEE